MGEAIDILSVELGSHFIQPPVQTGCFLTGSQLGFVCTGREWHGTHLM